MIWRLGGQFVVVGGWLVQAQGTPQNSIIRFRIIRVLRINSVLYCMGRLRSLYDPSLDITIHTVIYGVYIRFWPTLCMCILAMPQAAMSNPQPWFFL